MHFHSPPTPKHKGLSVPPRSSSARCTRTNPCHQAHSGYILRPPSASRARPHQRPRVIPMHAQTPAPTPAPPRFAGRSHCHTLVSVQLRRATLTTRARRSSLKTRSLLSLAHTLSLSHPPPARICGQSSGGRMIRPRSGQRARLPS